MIDLTIFLIISKHVIIPVPNGRYHLLMFINFILGVKEKLAKTYKENKWPIAIWSSLFIFYTQYTFSILHVFYVSFRIVQSSFIYLLLIWPLIGDFISSHDAEILV